MECDNLSLMDGLITRYRLVDSLGGLVNMNIIQTFNNDNTISYAKRKKQIILVFPKSVSYLADSSAYLQAYFSKFITSQHNSFKLSLHRA